MKTQKQPILATFDDANRALKKLGYINSFLQNMEADMNLDLQQIKDKYSKATAAKIAEKQTLESDLENFAILNKNEFEKNRSRELQFGKIGFRFGTPKTVLLNRKYKWDTVLELISKIFGKQYIREKCEVNKDAILADYSAKVLDDQNLASVGLKIDQDDRFFYDINWDSLENE